MFEKPTYEDLEKRVRELEKADFERKQTEEALRESEEKYRHLFNNAPVGIYEIDFIENKFISVNDLACEYTGYTKEELLSLNPLDFLAENSKKLFIERLERISAGEKISESVEYKIIGKTGKEICALLNNDFIYEDGKLKGARVVVHDITERKQAEEALISSEKEYRSTLNNLLIGIVLHNSDSSILISNPKASKILGLTREQMSGKMAMDPAWNFIHEDSHIMKVEDYPVNRVLSTQKPLYNYVLGIKRPDRDYVTWVLVNAIPLFSKNNILEKVIVNFEDITERRLAMESFLQNEKDLKKSQQIAHLGTWRLDLATNQVIWNEELYKMYGFDPTLPPPPYTEHMKLFTPDSWEILSTSLEKTNETGIPYELELETVRKDGSQGWMWVRGEAEKDSDGNTIGLWGAAQDISERKKIEESLRESEKKLYTIIDQSPFPIAFVDETDENIIYWSQSAIDTFGHNPSDVTEWYALAYPDSAYRKQVIKRWKPFLEKAYKTKKAINTGEYRIACKDGTTKICEIFAQFIPGNLVVSMNDITERKKSEKALQKNKDRLESLWNITKVTEADTKIMSDHILSEVQKMTESRYAFYGLLSQDEKNMVLHAWSHETMADCSAGDKQLHFPIDKAGIWADAVRERRTITINDFQSDQPGKKGVPDGHVLMTRLMAVPLIVNDRVVSIVAVANKQEEYTNDDEKQVQAFIRNAQIIINRKKTEEEKLELLTRLQQAQKMESIGTLAGGIAHDFNNILSSVIGFTELALDDVEKGTNVEDSLREVFVAGKRAKDLVKQILAFARQSDEENKPIQPSIIVKEVINFIRASIPTTVEIRQDIDSNSLIMGNPTQVHQILMNLFTNAAHAMEDNGGILGVSIKDIAVDEFLNIKTTDRKKLDLNSGDYIEIKVSDTGSGIAPEIIESIFEPYFTTKAIGEGTGMGLAMVHGIVEIYGGKITVDSTPGEGTVFSTYLPTSKKRGTDQQYVAEDLPSGTEHILFVDDELPIAKMTSQVLERLGYQVTIRTSSVEALELFRAKPDGFDLIISDMTMPNMTGDKLALELMRIRPKIPVVLCTGYSKKISDEIATKIGIKGFAYKPVVKSDLAKTVRKVLDETKN